MVSYTRHLPARIGHGGGMSAEIITRNQAMKEVMQQAKMVAATDARVLITGESGTGKELLAKAIHKASDRRNKPFVAINCSAMAEELLESELFGHERGAFTGATRSHNGLFQAAGLQQAHRAGEGGRYIATLFELIRLPAGHCIGPMVAIGKGTKAPWPKPGQLPLSEVMITDRF